MARPLLPTTVMLQAAISLLVTARHERLHHLRFMDSLPLTSRILNVSSRQRQCTPSTKDTLGTFSRATVLIIRLRGSSSLHTKDITRTPNQVIVLITGFRASSTHRNHHRRRRDRRRYQRDPTTSNISTAETMSTVPERCVLSSSICLLQAFFSRCKDSRNFAQSPTEIELCNHRSEGPSNLSGMAINPRLRETKSMSIFYDGSPLLSRALEPV